MSETKVTGHHKIISNHLSQPMILVVEVVAQKGSQMRLWTTAEAFDYGVTESIQLILPLAPGVTLHADATTSPGSTFPLVRLLSVQQPLDR